jgi:uncharacterized membrane protein
MKWLWGAILVASLAGNLILGATVTGMTLQRHFHPFSVAMKKIKTLPADERKAVHLIAKQEAPQLRQSLKTAREARQSLAAYIAGPDYNRAEAQRRFDDLRAKTAQSQLIAETMFLDMADKLPPQDRAKLLDAHPGQKN